MTLNSAHWKRLYVKKTFNLKMLRYVKVLRVTLARYMQ